MSTTDTPWQKSTASQGAGGCVQLRRHHGRAEIGDSKLGKDSPILSFNHQELAAFIAGVRGGEFDHLLEGID